VAADETRPVLPPGLISGLLFFAVVVLGSGYIIFSKLHDFGALAVTAVPVLIMVGYGVLLGARLFRLRDDQAGDNLYYMGFLFTLTSLAVSLYQFSAAGSAEQIVQNFGIAIASTIAGITLRILFNQMRRDPVEVEATARLELAEASRRVKRELESAILEFGYFRRMTQQSIGDALDEVRESIGKAHEQLGGELKKLAATASLPFEEASQRSGETLDGLNERTVQVLEVSKQLVHEGEQLAKNTTSIVKAIDALFARLASHQAPEQTIDTKLAPMIQNLTLAVNSLNKSAETQARNMEAGLRHAQSLVAATNQLLQEIRAAETPYSTADLGPQKVTTDNL
jgi:methyl-accepting chemotaxis protein